MTGTEQELSSWNAPVAVFVESAKAAAEATLQDFYDAAVTVGTYLIVGVFVVFVICFLFVLFGIHKDMKNEDKEEADKKKAKEANPISFHPYFKDAKQIHPHRDLELAWRMRRAHDTSEDPFFRANVLVTFKHLVEAWEVNEKAVKVGFDNKELYAQALNLVQENFDVLESGHHAKVQLEQLQLIKRMQDTNAALTRKSDLDL